jgi:hypothetical protein
VFPSFFTESISSQSIFNEINPIFLNLDASENIIFQNLTNNPTTKQIKVVEIGSLKQLIDTSGKLTLSIPFVNSPITAMSNQIKENSTMYIWNAKVIGNHIGNMGFTLIDSLYGAWFNIDNRAFELMPFKDGFYTFRELKNEGSETCNTPKKAVIQNSCDDPDPNCTVSIDILVLSDQNHQEYIAKNYLRYKINKFGVISYNPVIIQTYLSTLFEPMNEAFTNSKIKNKTLNFIYENVDANIDPSCTNTLIANKSLMESRRIARGADLVILLYKSGTDCKGVAYGVFDKGLAGNNEKTAIADYLSCLPPRYTGLHELGHLFGARHELADDPSTNCNHAFKRPISNTSYLSTLVHTWRPFGNFTEFIRQLYYSSSDLSIQDPATFNVGTIEEDNAQIMKIAACTFANNSINTNNFEVNILNTYYPCNKPGNIDMLSCNLIPASGSPTNTTYTYEWRWNLSGNFSNPSTYIGNQQNTLFTFPINNAYIWVMLKVVSSNGDTQVRFKKIEADPLCPVSCLFCRKLNDNESKLSLFPNPNNGILNLKWKIKDDEYIIFNIYNILGKIVYTIKAKNHANEENNLQIDISNIPSGNYIMISSSENLQETRVFNIFH